MNKADAPYSAKDLSQSLGIGDSSLRKWCLSLEEHGYTFYRTDQNKRLFTEKDIIVLKHYQQLVQEKNMSMNNAALIVTAKFLKEPFSNGTEVEQIETEMNTVPVTRSDIEGLLNRLSTMEEQQSQLIDMNRLLLSRLDEQQKYIDERLNSRDSLLLESIRETQATKQLLLEQQEQQKKPRKGLLRFFTKE